jgi:hypothetical protein
MRLNWAKARSVSSDHLPPSTNRAHSSQAAHAPMLSWLTGPRSGITKFLQAKILCVDSTQQKIAALPTRERLNRDYFRHSSLPHCRTQRSPELFGWYAGFGSLLPSHLRSSGTVDLNEIFLARTTREREQADSFGAAFSRRSALFWNRVRGSILFRRN